MIIERAKFPGILKRLREPRRFIQVLAGPRQVGKTTLVHQLMDKLGIPAHYASADEPAPPGPSWIALHWEVARALGKGNRNVLLVLDEVQKVTGWGDAVKALWDADTRTGTRLKVVLLGSSPLLLQRGMGESLTGRFERSRLGHWSFSEMRDAFGWTLDDWIYYGGYPGSASLVHDPERWSDYILGSLVETTVVRDLLMMTRVDKPALLRRLFHLASAYSGRELSLNKMLGQLTDAGNTSTLAGYADLLEQAGMLMGLQKFSSATVRTRSSTPKWQVLNNALFTAHLKLSAKEARKDPVLHGRIVESAVGAHLANGHADGLYELNYWRERDKEVDFVVHRAGKLTAIEVKSGKARTSTKGMDAFVAAHGEARLLLVGGNGIPLEEFLSVPPAHWIA